MAANSASPNPTPMGVMLAVMRDPDVALDMRVKMALMALPHLIESCVQVNPHLVLAMNLCLLSVGKNYPRKLSAGMSRRSENQSSRRD
jgi:hypothetical protein